MHINAPLDVAVRHPSNCERIFRHQLAAATSILLGAPAFAQTTVDQVERLDTEANETEFELQSILVDRTANEDELQLHIFSAEHGVSDRVALGFELQTEVEAGEKFSADSLLAQVKSLFLGHDDSLFRLGAQSSAGASLAGGRGKGEIEFRAEGRWLGLDLAADVMVETSFDGDAEFGYVSKPIEQRELSTALTDALQLNRRQPAA